MENAVEALKMAFAVIVFVIALSVSIKVFSEARQTSDLVLTTADETAHYDYEDYTKNGTSGENRIVGMETIIPTLYKYSKENYTVRFLDGTKGYDYLNAANAISGLDKIEIYTTPIYNFSVKDLIGEYMPTNTNLPKPGDAASYNYFDISAEETRQEPWTISPLEIQKHLDSILSNGKYILPEYVSTDGSEKYIDYEGNKLFSYKNSNSKFVELVGRKTTTKSTTDANTDETLTENKTTTKNNTEETLIGNKTTTKTVITYVLIN